MSASAKHFEGPYPAGNTDTSLDRGPFERATGTRSIRIGQRLDCHVAKLTFLLFFPRSFGELAQLSAEKTWRCDRFGVSLNLEYR